MIIVLDASVAIEWYLPSGDRNLAARARQILELGESSDLEFIAPDFFWAEVGNVFGKSVRQKRWTVGDLSTALRDLEGLEVVTEPSRPLLPTAINLAVSHQQAVYDTIYVALAIDRNVEMITADLRLYNALGSRFPVRWLGGWIARR